MSQQTYSAIFNQPAFASKAVNELRAAGVEDDKISIVAKDDGDTVIMDGSGDETHQAAKDITGKAAAGAGVGTLAGIAALAIPGVGPFVAGGAIAQGAIGGAAVAGAATGAAAGGIVGALQDHGIPKEDAEYYEAELNRGGVLVACDVEEADASRADVHNILYRAGGHSSGQVQQM